MEFFKTFTVHIFKSGLFYSNFLVLLFVLIGEVSVSRRTFNDFSGVHDNLFFPPGFLCDKNTNFTMIVFQVIVFLTVFKFS